MVAGEAVDERGEVEDRKAEGSGEVDDERGESWV
jgi:hypothetical protein